MRSPIYPHTYEVDFPALEYLFYRQLHFRIISVLKLCFVCNGADIGLVIQYDFATKLLLSSQMIITPKMMIQLWIEGKFEYLNINSIYMHLPGFLWE